MAYTWRGTTFIEDGRDAIPALLALLAQTPSGELRISFAEIGVHSTAHEQRRRVVQLDNDENGIVLRAIDNPKPY